MACEVWIVGTEGSLDFWTTIKLVLDISFAGSSVLVVSADASSEGALAAASLAEYFNQCLRRYRNKALSRGEKFSKVRPLKPCLDLNHEVYYRSKRDKYIPLEVFNHTFNPFPNVHHPRRYCYPEAPKPSVQTIP